jgi:caffeoyl-CoA O-methyltransferase
VLEIGTFSGYGALSLAEGLGPEGRVVTLELDPERAWVARRHAAGSPHPDRVEVRLGRALELLEDLPGPWDLVFIDADKTSYPDYYEAALARLAPRGLIAVDNTLRGGRVIDPDDESTRAIAAFNDRVRDDPRVRCVLLTVRDGLTLIRRADP